MSLPHGGFCGRELSLKGSRILRLATAGPETSLEEQKVGLPEGDGMEIEATDLQFLYYWKILEPHCLLAALAVPLKQ